MKRDKITISDNRIVATGQDIWMSAVEIAELFNVTTASVNNAIRGILKTDTLNDYEVCRCVRVNDRVSMDVYSLELIIPIAYRFDTCLHELVSQMAGASSDTKAEGTAGDNSSFKKRLESVN